MFETPPLADIRARIKPTNLGHEAGEGGLPPLEAKEDPHERPIVEEIQGVLIEARSLLHGQLDEARKHLAGLDSDPLGDVNATVKTAESRINDVSEVHRPALQGKRVEAEKRRTDLARFRTDNDLDRSPHYPEAGWKVFWWGLVAILFVGESFANSIFLARGQSGGLLGAYAIAFGISLANLIPPFLGFGPYSRNLSHVRRARKIRAGLATAIYIALVVILNLGVAHYREVSGELIGDAGVEVVRRMGEAPLNLQDAESWLLFVIGIILSIIAFFDGWKLDDAYPGYGKLDRIMRKAREDYLDARNDVADELAEIRDESLDKARRISADVRKQPQERRRVALNCRRLCDAFERHVEDVQEVGSTLINEYREANRRARPDGGVPLAHQSPWRLKVVEKIDRTVLDDLEAPSGDQTEVEQAYREATDRIHAHYETVRTSLLATDESTSTTGGADPSPLRS